MVELPCTLHCTLLRFSARQHQGLLSLGKRKVATSTVQAVALPLVGKVQPSGSGAGHRLSPPYKLAKAYEDAQKKRPYATQVSSLVVIYACGDFLAQGFERENYDPWRTLRNMIIGGMVAVPSYKWFIFLGRSFNYSSKFRSLATKAIFSQIVFAPVMNTYFFGMQPLLAGDGFLAAWKRIKDTGPTSYINSWKLWPAVTMFNFAYIRPEYRSLFAGIVAVGWQAYLSWLNQGAAKEEMVRKLTARTGI